MVKKVREFKVYEFLEFLEIRSMTYLLIELSFIVIIRHVFSGCEESK